MDIIVINDIRAIIMVLLLSIALILVIKTISIDTAKRIYRIYKWTDIRYREMILLAGCIASSTLSIECFDDAQRIATVGTGLSNWLEIGPMPADIYHYSLMVVVLIMLPVNFGIFLYKMYHTEKGSPNKRIMAEMIILALVPLVIFFSYYFVQSVLFAIELLEENDFYGCQSTIKAVLFLISIIYQIYDAYSVKKKFDFTRLDVKNEIKTPKLIWGHQKHRNCMALEQNSPVGWTKCREIYYRITRSNK